MVEGNLAPAMLDVLFTAQAWGVGVVANIIEAVLGRWLALSFLSKLNLLLALGGALVALGAANRMSRETEWTIILAFSTTGAGLVGYMLGSLLPERWQEAMDTVLLGGMCALLVGTRRQTIWIKPAWMPRISYGVTLFTWGAFFWGVR